MSSHTNYAVIGKTPGIIMEPTHGGPYYVAIMRWVKGTGRSDSLREDIVAHDLTIEKAHAVLEAVRYVDVLKFYEYVDD